jgi:ACS family hexuronate transporter-like MFS transporter
MKHVRWAILTLLFFASVINYIDRQSLSILARTIQDELHISEIGYSTIVQVFLFAYMLAFLVAGYVADRLGIRASMALFIGWWSAANIVTGFVGSLRGLAATRFLLGMGEAGLYVVAPKVVGQMFPASQRGLAVGIYSAGATIGATIAPPLIAWLALNHGWRSAFVAGGILGLIWIVPWLLTYRAPLVGASMVGAPSAAGVAPAAEPDAVRWWQLFLCREVLLLLAVRALTDPVWQFVLFWFPKYLIDVHGLSLDQVGRIGWVPYLAADVGGVLGGLASGLLIRRGLRAPDARKWVMALCAMLIPCGVLVVPQLPLGGKLVVAVMAVVAFAEFTWMVTMTALAVDVLPVGRIGRMFGIISAGSGLGGMLFMYAVGHLVTSFSYTPVFVLMACVHPAALVCVWWVAKSRTADESPVATVSGFPVVATAATVGANQQTESMQ